MKKIFKLIKRKTIWFDICYKPFCERVCDKLYFSGGGELIVKFAVKMPDKNYLTLTHEKELLFNEKYKIIKNNDYFEFIDFLEKQADIEIVSF